MFYILFSIIICSVLWYVQRRRQMSLLKRNGIPGPEPDLFFGYLAEARHLTTVQKQSSWIEKYGKVVGCYSGSQPMVLVTDSELLKNIQIKDFDKFTDRPIAFRSVLKIMDHENILGFSRGDRWKKLRSLFDPSFSSANLKNMSKQIEDSIDCFLEIVDEKAENGVEFDIDLLFQKLITDVLFRTFFGIRFDVQKGETNRYLDAINNLNHFKVNKFELVLIKIFPLLEYPIILFRGFLEKIKSIFGCSPYYTLANLISQVIDLRTKNPDSVRNDVLQSMLDTSVSKQEHIYHSLNETEQVSMNEDQVESKIKSIEDILRLTHDEIKGNSIFFYGAGLETTTSTLSFVAHILVNYPEVQQNIRKEVKLLNERDGKLDFNTLNELQYMDFVLKETLRLYPPVLFLASRHCMVDYKYKHMTIPKGTTVVIPLYALHRDPDYWEEPHKFDPMRFSQEHRNEIQSTVWQPMGNGPRICIGKRFAWLQLKLCLAKLLINYELILGSKTVRGEPTIQMKTFSIRPKNGIYVKVRRIV